MKVVFKVIVILYILMCESVLAQYIGEECKIKSDGSQGECKLLSDCPKAQQALQAQQFPQTCGFQGTQPIVCCPQEVAIAQRVAGEISKQKCREYSKYVNIKSTAPVLLIDAEEIERNECGFKVVELIVGGTKAKKFEFPHMAIIGYEAVPGDIRWQCGGTIISEYYIMTAGHCLESREFGVSKYVRVGMTNLNDRSSSIKRYNIAQRIPHPNYKPPSHYNDLGLLKLDKKADMKPNSRPACLYMNNDIHTKKAIATGWGKVDYAGEGSEDLLKVTLEFFDQPKCNESYRGQIGRKLKNGIMGDIQVCAGSEEEEKDTCQGDSGGPLQIYHIKDDIKCMYDIVGVTSFGKACGIGKSPGIYTRVSAYIKWIEDIVWP